MAESKTHQKLLAGIFAKKYNAIHGSCYLWDDARSFQPDEPHDFVLFNDEDERLGVQVSSVHNNAKKEVGQVRYVNTVISHLENIAQKVRLPGTLLYLNFHTTPPTNKEASTLAHMIFTFVRMRLQRSRTGGSSFTYRARQDGAHLKFLLRYLDAIEFKPLPSRDVGFSIIFGVGEASLIRSAEDRIFEAVEKKTMKYTGLYDPEVLRETILLLDSGIFTIDEHDLRNISNFMDDLIFKEVWVVNNTTLPKANAYKVL